MALRARKISGAFEKPAPGAQEPGKQTAVDISIFISSPSNWYLMCISFPTFHVGRHREMVRNDAVLT